MSDSFNCTNCIHCKLWCNTYKCQRNPPVVDGSGDAVWPRVTGAMVCGEFRGKNSLLKHGLTVYDAFDVMINEIRDILDASAVVLPEVPDSEFLARAHGALKTTLACLPDTEATVRARQAVSALEQQGGPK